MEFICLFQISILMTHLSNYGNDQLGLYTFVNLASFMQSWTNLRLQTLPPMQLAYKYFELFPDQKDPLWQNPCDDKCHRDIWSKEKTCDRLPKFLVIGPQKTGTTALYLFLVMHPSILSNSPSPKTLRRYSSLIEITTTGGLIDIWISSQSHLMSPLTFCLRRVPITSTQRKLLEEWLPCSPKPRSSAFSLTHQTEHILEALTFDSRKGFWCQLLEESKTKCLGRSKGRKYSPMDPDSRAFLSSYYRDHNVELSKLLHKLRQPLPSWLRQELQKTIDTCASGTAIPGERSTNKETKNQLAPYKLVRLSGELRTWRVSNNSGEH
ncbi:Bifunctional Heparan Sulfate N-Deacetylase/N-Sulfotransferase 3 [Manis pentadactyla]|nr:Bifunctional Heparan Sulfate N-Deacetylase/N-Sulfotransferase 3 [Manis pentadactyla]